MTAKLSYYKIITVLLLISGGVLSMMSFLSFGMRDKLFPILILCAIMIISIVLRRIPFLTQRYEWIPAVCAVLTAVALPSYALRGLIGYINMLMLRWDSIYNSTFIPDTTGTSVLDLQVFLIIVGCLGTFLLLYLVRRERNTTAFAIVIGSLLIQMIVYESSPASIVCILTGILCLGIDSMHIKLRNVHKIWLVGIFLIIAGSAAVLNGQTTQVTQSVRHSLYKKQHTICYGDDSLPEGDLYKANQMLTGSDDRLMITTEARQKLYLRGFVGSQYAQGKWDELSPLAYSGKYKGILEWLQKQNFSPLSQYEDYHQAGKSEESSLSVDVKNVGADREFVYVPYSTQNVSDGAARLDQQFHSRHLFGTKQYSFQYLTDSLPTELVSADKWIESPQTDQQQNYVSAEAVYREFVYEKYLELDEDTAKDINAYFWNDTSEESTGVYYATQQIRKVLRQNTSYTAEFADIPEDTDPIAYFLNISHEGNSALFASAAVQAYRAYGIPARYAEGYLANMEQAASDELTLTEKDSHAWVEIYMDGIGWMPIDVTPGFYYETDLLEQMVSKPDTIKETAAPQTNSDSNADDTVLDTKGQGETTDEESSSLTKILHVVLVGVDVVVSLFLLLLILLEIRYLWKQYHLYTLLEKSREKLCTDQLWDEITKILNRLGIVYSLGHQTKDTEQQIIDRGIDIQPGEYQRVSQLMEKRMYGETELTLWEQRVVSGFLVKCWKSHSKLKFKDHFKLRYL